MDTIRRIELGVSHLLRVILLVAVVIALWRFDWTVLFISISALLLIIFLPRIIERSYKLRLPLEFELALTLFIFATLFLGEIHDYYTRFWWWDVVLHAGSAIGFGLIGFLILYALHASGKLETRPVTIAVFSFTFAVAMGALWEVFEFSLDQLFGFNTQSSGLIDTMWDLIMDSIGALITSFAGFTYLKHGKARFFDRAIALFVSRNKKLFRKAR